MRYCAEVFLYSRVTTEQVKLTGMRKAGKRRTSNSISPSKKRQGKKQKAEMIHAELKLPNKPGRSITNVEIQNLNRNQYI